MRASPDNGSNAGTSYRERTLIGYTAEKSYSASYAAAGVDITAGYRSVELMKQYVARTMTENVHRWAGRLRRPV